MSGVWLRFIVYGAGAIGSTLAARLHETGHDVAVVARGRRVQDVRQNGLVVTSPAGSVRAMVPVLEAGDAFVLDQDTDIVLVAVKTQDADDALRDVREHADGANLAVVCAQNGVAAERMALRRFERVYGMCVFAPVVAAKGKTLVHWGPILGLLDVGRVPRGEDDVTQHLVRSLTKAGFDVDSHPDVMALKYAKLKVSLLAGLAALCGEDARNSDYARCLIDEADLCFAAAGISVAADYPTSGRLASCGLVRPVAGETYAGSSTRQALVRPEPRVETDYLNGEIALLGRLFGIATPANSAVQAGVRRMASQHALPGSLTLDQLRSLAKGDM